MFKTIDKHTKSDTKGRDINVLNLDFELAHVHWRSRSQK